ncbi:phosphoribosylglycinamide formyltransferase [Arenibacter sp. F20364]|uniref:phosphoribosylglycinamide formyltransferase n=1 Tax=Arenibacter sp. F20364 TaxID=2926415 RepID=UPI001FF3D818|nr:phosphoribosylglycinamide formyltransferase [Arenibacter sp. F20364]MCK0192785.1 phosphoribosylglycinamide formyltransferase [Arenibacter sp. F20364]
MKRIVLFASGSGSNVENIVHYFRDNPEISISCVLSNKREAKVFDRCNRLNINALYFNKHSFYGSDCVLNVLKSLNPDLIVLAGFLWKIPDKLISSYPDKIVNIHPALLPKYGGKGMYGMHVHQAIKDNNEKETGVTIHYVNENYDEGAIIKQAKVDIDPNDTPEMIAQKVHDLEYEYFPKVIEQVLMGT